ncbi:MAG: glycosyltransferase [Actinomycetia bacterium]|nr:glycosyltransferase [Actinomycetes bacterium]
MTRHLLVTNDFPPKVGGIQSYLWELWRRLPPEEFTVLTSPHKDAAGFDADQPFRVVRTREPWLLPTRWLRRRIDALAAEVGAKLVVLDPALPVGKLGPELELPYAVVLHGAEVTVPGRLPGAKQLLAPVLRGATHVFAAGTYPSAEADRAAGQALPTTIVPPGVDTDLFRPLGDEAKREARARLGLPTEGRLVMGISRLVPRKGFDALIEAAALLKPSHPDLTVGIVGGGRDRKRLDKLAEKEGAPVQFLGKVPFTDLPAAYACGDVFAMLCRNRWAGLEQEGFGIVFLEAAASGVPVVAGASGGVRDAVVHGQTGLVVERPTDPHAVSAALARLLADVDLRRRMGHDARRRAVESFDYDVLAERLWAALQGLGG